MNLHYEITKRIEGEVSRLAASLPAVEWYVFGSFLTSDAPSSDVDILVVHPITVNSGIVRAQATALCAELPIHMLVMTHDEQSQLDFIASQHCVRIIPDAAPGKTGASSSTVP